MTESLHVLIVDDESNIRKTLALCLETEGHQVVAVSNEKDALTSSQANKYDLVFLDMRLGVSNGLDLIPKLLGFSPWLKIVVITAHASIDNAVEAMRRGTFDYLEKPFATAQVYALTRKVAHLIELEKRVRNLEQELSKGQPTAELSSQSPVMERAIELARSAAPTDATILITGENGTGKSLLARSIHRWSARATKPFVVVSCPSLSAELLESELFGHIKGAFTGAIKNSAGKIAACEGGTLFLDEIGDLPMGLQAKLLRFLQDREYEHVGDTATRKADVRVITATNINLKDAIKAGRFREDLFYRLNVIEITMPPLRDRIADTLSLAQRFLAELRHNKNIHGFTPEATDRLTHYTWPGNIRELRNIIERAIILCNGHFIEAVHLTIDEAALPSVSTETLSLEQTEEAQIRKILGTARSMEDAARILGIDTVTLWRKRKRYGL